MKHKLIIINCVVILFVGAYSLLFGEGDNAQDQPNIFIPDSSYEFDPVPDGTNLSHDFVIKNTGKAPLDIYKVQTG